MPKNVMKELLFSSRKALPYESMGDIDEMDVVEFLHEEFELQVRGLIERYERRHKINSESVATAGIIKTWNHHGFGYNVKPAVRYTPFFGDYDFEFGLNEENQILLRFHHHDGIHEMNLYMIPESLGVSFEHLTVDEVETIIAKRKPLKADKRFIEYYGIGNTAKVPELVGAK